MNRNQVTQKYIADGFRKEVDNVVTAVENRVHDVIVTAMDSVVTPRVEMAERSMAGWLERGPISVVQNPDQTDLNINQNKNDETRNSEHFEDGNFPGFNFNCDWQTHTLHTIGNWWATIFAMFTNDFFCYLI